MYFEVSLPNAKGSARDKIYASTTRPAYGLTHCECERVVVAYQANVPEAAPGLLGNTRCKVTLKLTWHKSNFTLHGNI